MKSFSAFLKKEWLESVRSGKAPLVFILFILLGILNPAIAKLTPWMMEQMADSLQETGMMVMDVRVNALTSWTQFFKNIPMALIAFILIYSNLFTKEYQSGTLLLVLTKGLSRYKTVLAKFILPALIWTVCYWLCFAVTGVYNAYFWDNRIAHNLFLAIGCWWLFGIWVITMLVLFSVLCRSGTGVLSGVGGAVLAVYLAGLIPRVRIYMPTTLMGSSALLIEAAEVDSCIRTIIMTTILCVVCIVVSIPVMNRKQL